MILLSRIVDGSKVTLDCAKATLEKGSRIEIDDIHWKSPEVQGAIKLGFIELSGEPPIFPEDPQGISPARMIRFRNAFTSKLCFDCIKDYADPGKLVLIPVSMVDHPEVRNAILAGWLLNEDNPEQNPEIYVGPAMHLEELRTSDILSAVDSESASDLAQILNKPAARNQELPAGVPATRPQKSAPSQIKAKRVSGGGDTEDDGGADELYRPSEVRLPKKESKRANTQIPQAPLPKILDEGAGDDDFDFTDIFSSKKK